MRITVSQATIELVQGDITEQAVDAIVNAANSKMAGGGGVDGAIHRAAGSAVMEETDRRYPEGCPTGSAVISGAGELPANHVIHAVGPVWGGGNRGEADQLASAYRTSLELAEKHDCTSIALPALSAGAYRFPMDQVARISLTTARDFLQGETSLHLVRFVLFGEGAFGAFAAAMEELQNE